MIKINNLTKKYKEKYAVNNLNLEIKSGELFSLLGTNGAGKTTTIKMLSTLILPTSGEVKINNFDLTKDSAKIKEIINRLFKGNEFLHMIRQIQCLNMHGKIKETIDKLFLQKQGCNDDNPECAGQKKPDHQVTLAFL